MQGREIVTFAPDLRVAQVANAIAQSLFVVHDVVPSLQAPLSHTAHFLDCVLHLTISDSWQAHAWPPHTMSSVLPFRSSSTPLHISGGGSHPDPRLGTFKQPPNALHPSTVQGFLSSQLTTNSHPLTGSHLSTVQVFLSSQDTTLLGRHEPLEHWSPSVHELPSLHSAMLLLCTHPLAFSQVSSVQTLPSEQSFAVPALQAFAAQVSPLVQVFPSSQATTPATAVSTQPVAEHVSCVHTFPSSHTWAIAQSTFWQRLFRHAPPLQSPFTKQVLPAMHGWQADPPQSTSVSPPFFAPSLQVGFALQ